MSSEDPPAKRAKHDEDDNILDILSPNLLASENELRIAYQDSKPYPHGRLENMFQEGFLENVFEEIQQNSKVNFKESDLFRVYQSVDMGNLNDESPEIQKTFPSLLKLKAALYSPKYRAFIERIANLPPDTLTGQVDCAANCHAPGCHLLCHDDVIGTRKVSYILYLTEEGWKAEEGGALELYDHYVCDDQRLPKAIPSKTILPTFNSMAYFVVQPGTSFHAVQEVFGERPRLSIQGWYHALETPFDIERATLSRLKSTGKGEDTEGDFLAFEVNGKNSSDSLSSEDKEFLAKYINGIYLTPESMKDIQERFEEESSIQLRQFLNEEWSEKIRKATEQQDAGLGNGNPSLDYNVCISDSWKLVGPAHKQRFLEYTGGTASDDAGAYLTELKQKVFQSAPFGRFLKLVTSVDMPLGARGRVRRFRPGLDYTVAHYGILTTKTVLDATLCFCAGKGEQCRVDEETGELVGTDEDAIWASGDCGGFECYIEGDDEEEGKQEAADEYNEDDDTELLSVSASNNTLSLVYRDPGTMRFVKYVGCRAPSSRWDIGMEYQVPALEGDEEKPSSD